MIRILGRHCDGSVVRGGRGGSEIRNLVTSTVHYHQNY